MRSGRARRVGVTAHVAAGAYRVEPDRSGVAPTKGSSMPEHNPTPELVTRHPERIHGYDYGTERAAASP
jgi:hypothetical protein